MKLGIVGYQISVPTAKTPCLICYKFQFNYKKFRWLRTSKKLK